VCRGVECWHVFVLKKEAEVWGRKGCALECSHALACSDGMSPVWIASEGGFVSCVEALIRAQADVLQCDT